MKRLLFSIVIGVLSIGTACVRQGNPDTTKSPEQLQYERAVYLIKEMGYDISDIRSAANGYIVEGDILLTQRHLDEFESRVQTRQNFNQYWLTVRSWREQYHRHHHRTFQNGGWLRRFQYAHARYSSHKRRLSGKYKNQFAELLSA